MSNYNSLKTTINANVKQNGVQAITGQILNSVLNAMVTTLGTGYQFAGVATTATNPGSPDAKVFYIANGKGMYTNFGGISVTEDDVVVLYWDSSWHKVSTGIASQEKLSDLDGKTIEIEGMVMEAKADASISLNKVNAAEPLVDKVKNLGWSYKFNGVSSIATLNEPIVLQNNGDSIEFVDLEINTTALSAGYGFSKGGHSSQVGIGIYNPKEGVYQINVRADDGTFMFQRQLGVKPTKVKLSYENDDILLIVNDSSTTTYQGQKKLSLLAFGKGSPNYNFWKGQIGSILVNGNEYSLLQNASLTDVELFNVNGFLTDEQARQLSSSSENMYAEKTATKLIVYIKNSKGLFFGYPLVKRFSPYTEGAYPSFYDNWGIYKVGLYEFANGRMNLIAELFQGGEAELAINATSGNSSNYVYVGGSAHGFDNIVTEEGVRCITFLVDNQKFEESEEFELKPISSVSVVSKAELCQAYTPSNPFAIAIKNWFWDYKGFRIKTKVQITRVINIHQAQLGMMCVLRRWKGSTSEPYLTSRAIKNNMPFKVFNVEDGWSSELVYIDHGCTKITEYGEKGYGFAMEIIDADTKSNGGMFVQTNGTGLYNKIYYANCNSFVPEVGSELNATQVWSLEA